MNFLKKLEHVSISFFLSNIFLFNPFLCQVPRCFPSNKVFLVISGRVKWNPGGLCSIFDHKLSGFFVFCFVLFHFIVQILRSIQFDKTARINRNSLTGMSYEKDFKSFSKFTGKQLLWALVLIKLQDKNRLQRR